MKGLGPGVSHRSLLSSDGNHAARAFHGAPFALSNLQPPRLRGKVLQQPPKTLKSITSRGKNRWSQYAAIDDPRGNLIIERVENFERYLGNVCIA